MAIKDVIRNLLGYRLGGGGSYLSNMAIPPGLNYQRYLEIYGEVGWLFGAVSLIANSVAAVDWKLYSQKAKGEDVEIDMHPLIDLLNHVNPFQTRYQFMLLLQTYVGLVGEAFIVLSFNKLHVPGMMELAPPGYMNIVPSPDKYISHYEYKRGNNTLRLEIPEVIHIMDANPANPYRGIGAAKAVGIDIESEYYAARYQQRLFYNDATPGLIMEFPDTPPAEERKNLREEFLETHQGWRNARRPAFLWGGAKANTIALAPKDMEYGNLRNANKKLILGAYHIPDSLIGASEVGSRARAEADEYIFGKYTIKPALTRIREALNEQLCPLFDDSIRLDFADPVPADAVVERGNNREDFKAGIITREEARLAIGLDAEADSGQTYMIPFSVIEQPAKILALSRAKQSSRWNDEQKEAYWQVYKAKTEAQEKPFIRLVRALWDEQKKEAITSIDNASTADSHLFDEKQAIIEFDKAFKPLIMLVFQSAVKDILAGHEPEPAHTLSLDTVAKIEPILNAAALKWIASRSLTLAKLLNGTTIEQLRRVLADGFEAGESIPQIRDRIEEYYTQANRVRATMVARTEVIGASNAGNLEAYKELGAEKKEWYSALDERTRPSHGDPFPQGAHGQVVGIKEDFRVGAGSGPAPGQIGLPEEDINCFLPDTLVRGNFVAGIVSEYIGFARDIITRSGQRLSITPNHPILTNKGLIPAKLLCKGDNLVAYSRGIKSQTPIPEMNQQDKPTLIQDVFEALRVSGSSSRTHLRGDNLHGDAVHIIGKVHIVRANGILGREMPPPLSESREKSSLMQKLFADVNHPGLCSFETAFERVMPASRALPSGVALLDNVIPRTPTPFDSLSFGLCPDINACLNEIACQHTPLDMIFLRELIHRYAGLIMLDEIVEIRDYDFSGHVYDLQSTNGLMIAENIINSNCRCVVLPVI